ncbi:probable ubiquitin-like-specific protease 2B [Hordeum vulgare subsp. vulgare]|uniref:probable ubiquitin-like-specific protease 2B n=1 Tax=Hordeum vulgare subsp. vulgare TaxID=112509 RepID=UPI001D1A3579|nr:probable ubiquitin-like-specific protease 2B [Hordeum vulgare subsp. vulgare]
MTRHSRKARNQEIVVIDLDGDDSSNQECQNKGREAKTRRSLQNELPSFQEQPPLKKRSTHINRRDKTKKEKLDTDTFELCMEDVWSCMGIQEKKKEYAYLNSLWFTMYTKWDNKSRILKWIKAKKIFTRRYVFVPIILWGHWSLLVLCNFGKTKYLGTKKGPRMLLLDSLKGAEPGRLQPIINRFIVDILKIKEREELEQFINEVKLEFPKVPQQSGEDCGMYVLYFVHCFLVNEKLREDLSHLDVLFDQEELKSLEVIREDICSYKEKMDAKTAE